MGAEFRATPDNNRLRRSLAQEIGYHIPFIRSPLCFHVNSCYKNTDSKRDVEPAAQASEMSPGRVICG
ncbi:hypothetical protein CHARACLAT_001650 [Characodon lateralis]|uniref:Uncharacterized protein n=1 Tax=Characodon lateralis TaxID=208331 RepID=A0ABU7E0U4_9TELE|nr:hypothetical protein [Characodon lateralis]